jgi:hypothetical protein
MKTLIYTVSDFKDGALDCIDLLYSNIKNKNFDFSIISNRDYQCKYNVFIDKSYKNYVGFLKYSRKIPEGYDQYIYLDSDIIYLGEAEDLFSNSEFSIIFEDFKMNYICSVGRKWFQYEYDNSQKYINSINNLRGLNAGTFCFKNYNFLAQVRNNFEKFEHNDVIKNAILEQSSFNYTLCKTLNFDFSKCFDLSNESVLHAKINSFQPDKKLYHFCGFTNTMTNKALIMKAFINENKNRIN